MTEEVLQGHKIKELRIFLDKYRVLYNFAMELEAHFEEKYAPNFSAFNFIPTNETNLSRIIAFLLDPNEIHGQKSLFLHYFIQLINKQILNTNNNPIHSNNLDITIVQTEVTTKFIRNKQRRIDILLHGDNWIIGIENKPYALESEDQVRDYQEEIGIRYDPSLNKTMIFLSKDNLQPVTANFDKKNVPVILMGYNNFNNDSNSSNNCIFLSDWIETIRNICHVEKIRQFLSDFLVFIQSL
jgi:hypothetical protein